VLTHLGAGGVPRAENELGLRHRTTVVLTNMTKANEQHKEDAQPAWLSLVRQKVESLHFGVVQIVVHDSKVVQIESTEKTRLNAPRGC
jgi:hypothetical protein